MRCRSRRRYFPAEEVHVKLRKVVETLVWMGAVVMAVAAGWKW
ncbi:MAG TPA: hypothetical protein VLA90_04595 [Actinomycetota bacterium]|nr:hypothetical protein [Actinomycetota bacterium]